MRVRARASVFAAALFALAPAGDVGAQPDAGAGRAAEALDDDDLDGDGFPDDIDECPEEPETRNGVADDDGCPDRRASWKHDADEDGLADDIDECPGEAETKNGFEDDDGCPDRAEPAKASSWSDPVTIPWAPDRQCLRTHDCQEHGECTWTGGECVIGSDDDCRHSTKCREEGACSKWRRACVAATTQDCRSSRICAEDGDCYLNRDERECDDGRERNSSGLLWGGVAVSGLGGAMILGGLVATLVGGIGGTTAAISGNSSDTAEDAVAAGPILLIAGGVAALAGVPLIIAGAVKVPRKGTTALTPTISIGPTGGSLTWRW
ncbi:MAG: hypothetical protein JRI55_33040 [Deltaproteobacteria bacterium]|nr:hypothetical protein [Deltaproteobacteria bacterium]